MIAKMSTISLNVDSNFHCDRLKLVQVPMDFLDQLESGQLEWKGELPDDPARTPVMVTKDATYALQFVESSDMTLVLSGPVSEASEESADVDVMSSVSGLYQLTRQPALVHLVRQQLLKFPFDMQKQSNGNREKDRNRPCTIEYLLNTVCSSRTEIMNALVYLDAFEYNGR